MFFLDIVESIFGGQYFVLISISTSFLLKSLIVFFTFNQHANTQFAQRLKLFLLVILGANMLSDVVWIQKLLDDMFVLAIDPCIFTFIGRLAWAFVGLQYQALAIFLEELVTHQSKLTTQQKICCIFTFFFVLLATAVSFIWFKYPEPISLIFTINRIAIAYYTLFLLPFTLFSILRILRLNSLPHILTSQLYLIIYGLIIPHLTSEIIQFSPLYFEFHFISNQTAAGLSALFLSIGLFYCSRKIMGLRFLNIRDQVHAPPKPDFIAEFKTILKRLHGVTNTCELNLIVQNFFQQSLRIPAQRTKLYVRPLAVPFLPVDHHYHTHPTVEKFIKLADPAMEKFMRKESVLIYDEINFSHFYEQTSKHENGYIF